MNIDNKPKNDNGTYQSLAKTQEGMELNHGVNLTQYGPEKKKVNNSESDNSYFLTFEQKMEKK